MILNWLVGTASGSHSPLEAVLEYDHETVGSTQTDLYLPLTNGHLPRLIENDYSSFLYSSRVTA
jgi:hypothetical protein